PGSRLLSRRRLSDRFDRCDPICQGSIGQIASGIAACRGRKTRDQGGVAKPGGSPVVEGGKKSKGRGAAGRMMAEVPLCSAGMIWKEKTAGRTGELLSAGRRVPEGAPRPEVAPFISRRDLGRIRTTGITEGGGRVIGIPSGLFPNAPRLRHHFGADDHPGKTANLRTDLFRIYQRYHL